MIGSVLQGIRVSDAVYSAVSRTSNGTTNMYTAPADGYAIINVCIQDSANQIEAELQVGGDQAVKVQFSATPSGDGEADQFANFQGVIVGPSQSVDFVVAGYGSGTKFCNISGVEFRSPAP